jgi:hypothetical protein
LTEEGKARYRSSIAQKSLANDVKKTVDMMSPMYDRNAKKVINSPQVKDILAKVKDLNAEVKKTSNESWKMQTDWYDRKNPEAYDKYTQMLAEKDSKQYGDGTKEDIEKRLWLIRNEDFDQGDSFFMYLNDHPKEKAKYDALNKKWDDLLKAQTEALKTYASEWLGEYGNEQIKSRQNKWNNYSFTVLDQLKSVMSLKLSEFYKW